MNKRFKISEDWVIVIVGAIILMLSTIFPQTMPVMPKALETTSQWLSAAYMFFFIWVMVGVTSWVLGRQLRGIFTSLLLIFLIALVSNVISNISFIKNDLGLEVVFFAVLVGLLVRNTVGVPEWMKPAIQSEFYIKIGIICLGSTILFGDIMRSGAYGLLQSLIVVISVWYFAFWLGKKFKVDSEMGTMLASAVSICGVSAAIATCGVIKGDNKKLSYVISLVLIIAVPMMYILPWVAGILGLDPEITGAWLGGSIDTTGAVAAAGTLADHGNGETAAQTAVIVKSSQNVLLGIAAFAISLFWTYKGDDSKEKPSLKMIWDRFPKFVVGFILASLFFSIFLDTETAKSVGKVTKGFQNTLFTMAFVCIGLETRFKDIVSRENRRPLFVFLIAQLFNILLTLVVAYIVFGLLKPIF